MNDTARHDGTADFYRLQAIGQARVILEHLQEAAEPNPEFIDSHVDLMNDYVASWLRRNT